MIFGVSFPHGIFNPLQSAVLCKFLELFFGQSGGLGSSQFQDFKSRLEGLLSAGWGVGVIGADGLAEVTARQIVVQGNIRWKLGSVLQGQVTDTFVGIEKAWFLQSPNGAGI